MKKIDLTGMIFGRLTVIEMIRSPGKDAKVRCACACGREKVSLAYNVRSGNTASCGCLAKEVAAESAKKAAPLAGLANRTHGMARTPTYQAWRGALSRCYRQKDKRYPDYGGRGIAVCDEWKASFSAFLRDMGARPDGMTLDRIEVNGNYEPNNCRWATRLQQARNTRANVATEAMAEEIRARRIAGASLTSLASDFGMTHGNVGHIVSGATWK
jgi:hypothetical protein